MCSLQGKSLLNPFTVLFKGNKKDNFKLYSAISLIDANPVIYCLRCPNRLMNKSTFRDR